MLEGQSGLKGKRPQEERGWTIGPILVLLLWFALGPATMLRLVQGPPPASLMASALHFEVLVTWAAASTLLAVGWARWPCLRSCWLGVLGVGYFLSAAVYLADGDQWRTAWWILGLAGIVAAGCWAWGLWRRSARLRNPQQGPGPG